mmetsp:Transcript_28901/g.47945  ORF Transcript_28901/g.47945 Transcript_28901/m.47945 type:complete len:325 (-) Transcript_28901:204-1178(-)
MGGASSRSSSPQSDRLKEREEAILEREAALELTERELQLQLAEREVRVAQQEVALTQLQSNTQDSAVHWDPILPITSIHCEPATATASVLAMERKVSTDTADRMANAIQRFARGKNGRSQAQLRLATHSLYSFSDREKKISRRGDATEIQEDLDEAWKRRHQSQSELAAVSRIMQRGHTILTKMEKIVDDTVSSGTERAAKFIPRLSVRAEDDDASLVPSAEVVLCALHMVREADIRKDIPVVQGQPVAVAAGQPMTGAGNTPYHWAALAGDVDKLQYLFLETDGPFDSVNADGLTPFQCAVQSGHEEAADEIALSVAMLKRFE